MGSEEKLETEEEPKRTQKKSSSEEATRFEELSDVAQHTVERIVLKVLDGRSFKAGLVGKWVESINQMVLNELTKACPNLKYIVSSAVFERAKGAGLQYSTEMYWDPTSDGSVDVSWENETIGCIVTVFGLAL